MKENFDYIIGSAAGTDVCLRHPDIRPRHAHFRRRGDRLFIKPLEGDCTTYINGSLVAPRAFEEFTRFDKLRLGRLPIELSSDLFMGRKRLGLHASPLTFRGRGGRLLADRLQVYARPGTLTAIMGPSGSGKSVLLKLISKQLTPESGEIFYTEGNNRLIPTTEASPNTLGYVPQGDTMFPELTPAESLDFRLKLLFPDMRNGVRRRLIEQTAARVGFTGKRRRQFLGTAIGSADASGAFLSGGERRRANLCLELVAQPLVLMLDEPTSGLSSRDADDVMRLLKHLAQVEGLTVITTLHQPSEWAFCKIDQLILLTYGGKTAYQGPAANAVEQIALKTGIAPHGKTSSEYVVESHEALSSAPIRDMPETGEFPNSVRKADTPQRVPERRISLQAFLDKRYWLEQLAQLCYRQFILMGKDHSSLLFAILQVPILFLLVYVTFNGSGGEFRDFDQLARIHAAYKDIEQTAGSMPGNGLSEAYNAALERTDIISAPHARHRAAFVYVLTLIAIWFGLMASCCEIVGRKEIMQREHRSGISLGQALFAVFSANALLALCQGLCVTFLSLQLLSDVNIVDSANVYRAVALVTLASTALGLLISSAGSSIRSAVTLVPVSLIPQILLGGLFRPLTPEAGVYTWLANLNPQRWAFEIALTESQFAKSGVVKPVMGSLLEGPSYGFYSTLNELVQFEQTGLKALYFPSSSSMAAITPTGALLSITAFGLFTSWLVCRTRFNH